jgi:ABC-type Zn2+ transport system substrate-binding protein/surface adhesin
MGNFNLTEKLKEELKKRNLWEQDDDEDDNDDDDDNDNEEDDDEEEDTESSNHNEDFCEMVCQILHSQTQIHIFHLGTKSYSEHKALQKYYEGIDALVDGVIESYQGKYGLLTNYKSFKNQSYKNKNQVLKYFTSLLNTIEEKRDCCDDSYIQNQIDTVQELIYSTMYKLKFLQ